MRQEFRVFRALWLTFQVWARNIVPITLLAAIVYAPVFLWIATYDLDSATGLDQLVDSLITYPVYGLTALSMLVAPMLTYRIVQDLNGARVSLGASVVHGLRGLLPAIIVGGITTGIQFLPVGGIVGAILTCVWFVAAPAAVAEKLGPFAALQRSAVLTSGRRLGIFGLNFLIGLVFLALVFAWIVPSLESADESFLSSIRANAFVLVGALTLLQLLQGLVAAVSYVLLRQDKDGVSHEQLARVFE